MWNEKPIKNLCGLNFGKENFEYDVIQ
jgi:hypothetical protein